MSTPTPRKSQAARESFNSGFSLSEMLVTLMIVTLLTACIATGIAFAQRHYHKSIMTSESKVLYSTLESALRNELSYTSIIYTDDNGDIWFYSLNYSDGQLPGGSGTDFRTYCWKVGAVKKGSSGYTVVAGTGGKPPIGQLALVRLSSSDTWSPQPLIASTAYTYDMMASAVLTASDDKSYAHVDLKVYSKDGDELVGGEFDVKPINTTIKTGS